MTHSPRPRRDLDSIQAGKSSAADFGKQLAGLMDGRRRHAILILDVSGVVRFAATRGMLGRPDDELVGDSLTSLIPELPIRETTPGYNVAYVRMTFADGWRRHHAVAGDQRTVPVELHVRALAIGRGYALMAVIRETDAAERARHFRGWQAMAQFDRGLAA